MHDDVHATPGHLNPGPGFDPEPVPDPGGALPPGVFAPLRRHVESWLPTRAARTWALALALLAVVHLVAHLVVPDGVDVARVTQWLLMPLLAATLWCSTPRRRLARLAVVALLCSWAGDTVPAFVPDTASFPVLMALFLVAQLVYVAAFLPYRADSVLVRRRGVVAGYAVAYAVIVGTSSAALLPQGGAAVLLVVGIAGYGAVLIAMALLATGVDRLAGLGGVLFLVSDALLGLAQALPDTIDALPSGVHGFLVMLTYLAAQTLLAAGVRRRCVRGHR